MLLFKAPKFFVIAQCQTERVQQHFETCLGVCATSNHVNAGNLNIVIIGSASQIQISVEAVLFDFIRIPLKRQQSVSPSRQGRKQRKLRSIALVGNPSKRRRTLNSKPPWRKTGHVRFIFPLDTSSGCILYRIRLPQSR